MQDGIELFHEYQKMRESDPTEKNEQLFLAMRDSMIQRFEYCTDLFWKVLKVYLQECMEMVTRRNETSHIYHEGTAEEIAKQVPGFYVLIKKIVDRIEEKLKKIKF